MEINIVEPVGGHGGMNYYDYGLAYGLGQNHVKVKFHTCIETQKLEYFNVITLYTFKNLWALSKVNKIFKYLCYNYKILVKIKKEKSKIVHFHFFDINLLNVTVLILTKLFDIKSVVTIHDVDSFHKPSKKWIEKFAYKMINGVIVHNQSSYNSLISKKINISNIKIIPHGNYLPFVDSLPLPKFQNQLNLLFFGQIKEVKGLDILLNAMALVVQKNKNVKLTIAGRPWKTDLHKYVTLIKELQLEDFVKTHFRYLDDNEIESFYRNSSVVVLPYRRIYQSGVLLLTSSYGRASITSNLPAFEEVITNNINGFTFESENIEDLARCILSLTHEKIIEVTKKTKEDIQEKYDWISIGKQTLNFYKSI